MFYHLSLHPVSVCGGRGVAAAKAETRNNLFWPECMQSLHLEIKLRREHIGLLFSWSEEKNLASNFPLFFVTVVRILTLNRA